MFKIKRQTVLDNLNLFYLNSDYPILHNQWMHSAADIYEFLSGCAHYHLVKIKEGINALPLDDESYSEDVSYAAIRALSDESINKNIESMIAMNQQSRETMFIQLAEDIRKKVPGAGTNLQLH